MSVTTNVIALISRATTRSYATRALRKTADMIDLTGRTALVTGASRGIGEAVARALDGAGAQVLLNSRSEEDIAAVAADLTNDPQLYAADLEASGAGGELAERVVADHGGVDILVNNAGIAMRRTPEQLTEEDVDRVFNINVRGLLMLTTGLGDAFIAVELPSSAPSDHSVLTEQRDDESVGAVLDFLERKLRATP